MIKNWGSLAPPVHSLFLYWLTPRIMLATITAEILQFIICLAFRGFYAISFLAPKNKFPFPSVCDAAMKIPKQEGSVRPNLNALWWRHSNSRDLNVSKWTRIKYPSTTKTVSKYVVRVQSWEEYFIFGFKVEEWLEKQGKHRMTEVGRRVLHTNEPTTGI